MKVFTRFCLLLLCSLFTILCISCKDVRKQDLQFKLENLYGRKVDLCLDDMKILEPSKRSSCGNTENPVMKVVSYVDSTSCTPCAIQNTFNWYNFLDSLNAYHGGIGVYFIFDVPRSKLLESLEEAEIAAEELKIPIYLDTLHVFSQRNQMQNLRKTYVVILDESNRICLVGSPIGNPELEKLFWREVKKMNINI